jgi:hypothetical protein
MNYVSFVENSLSLSNYFSRKLIIRRKYREKRGIDKSNKNAKNTLHMYPVSPLLTYTNIPQTIVPSPCPTKSILYIFGPYITGSPYAVYPTVYPVMYHIPTSYPVMYHIPRPSSCPTVYPSYVPTNVPTYVPTFETTYVPTFETTYVPTFEPSYNYNNDSANNTIQYSYYLNNNYNTPLFIIATSVSSLLFCVIFVYVYINYGYNKYKLQKIQKNSLKREHHSLNDVHIDYNREFKYL